MSHLLRNIWGRVVLAWDFLTKPPESNPGWEGDLEVLKLAQIEGYREDGARTYTRPLSSDEFGAVAFAVWSDIPTMPAWQIRAVTDAYRDVLRGREKT